jgi:hypothetical protein
METLTQNQIQEITQTPESWLEMRKRKMAEFRWMGVRMCKACVNGDCSVCEEPCPCVHHDLSIAG